MPESSQSLVKRSAEGLTQNTVANMITPYITAVVTGMIVWVLAGIAMIASWPSGWKIALIVGIGVVLTFLLYTLPALVWRSAKPQLDETQPSAVVPAESMRLIELRDDLDAVTRERNNAQTNLETCWNEQRATLKKLEECQSLHRLESGEVDRVASHAEEQIRIRDEQISERTKRINELEQQLRVTTDKLEAFNTLRARLKIKRAWYHCGDKGGVDVTEKVDQMVLDERLVIQFVYNDHFPDPCKGVRKHLTIDYSYGPSEFSIMVPENTAFALPMPHATVAP